MLRIVIVPGQNIQEPGRDETGVISQRCDIVLSADGALRIEIAGDWRADADVTLLVDTLRHVAHQRRGFSLDLKEAGDLAPRVHDLLREVTNPAQHRTASAVAKALPSASNDITGAWAIR